MQHAKLLDDAAGLAPGSSKRAKYHAVSQILGADGTPATPKAIENWFLRQSIPAKWLFAISSAAARAGRPIDLNNYA